MTTCAVALASLFQEGDAIPPRLYRDRSKGRLSWSDEFGGCLAEYYEVWAVKDDYCLDMFVYNTCFDLF